MTQRPARNKAQVIIIGGGASGLAAACVLARAQVPFLLLEKEHKLGRKLLATGNGRCNLMNLGPPVYFGDNRFASRVLAACGAAEVGEFFTGLGLAFFEEELGRVYPNTRQAATVLDCLTAGFINSPGAQVITGVQVTGLRQMGAGFEVMTASGERHQAPRIILAAGGPAAPKLGGSALMAQELTRLGHPLQPFFPALCALTTETRPIRGLNGLRVPAYVTLLHDGLPVSTAAGELLFANYGVSGLCAMQLARDAETGLAAGKKVEISLDFAPLLGLAPALMRRLEPAELAGGGHQAAALDLLTDRLNTLGRERLYTGLLPWAMAEKLQNLPIREAAQWLTGLRLDVTGTQGLDNAQVAAGGIDCRDISPLTLESKRAPGLYICGEILNVDGDTGGYNLLFAWATGILAGRAAGRG